MPKPKVDPEKVLEEGLYAAAESSGNSIEVSNDAYTGVADEYKNAAVDVHLPAASEEGSSEREVEDAVKAAAAANQGSGFLGYSTDDTHPSKRRTATQDAIDHDRAVKAAQDQAILDAAAAKDGDASGDDTESTDSDEEKNEGNGGGPPVP